MTTTEITIPNECSPDKVSIDHRPIVRDVIDSYRRSLDKLLVSVRLLGSAARGESVPSASDIDFVGLVSMSPDAYHRDRIAADARKLTLAHPCVRSVDMELEIKGRVSPSRELIFRTDSVCLWGEDDYAATEVRISSTSLAKLTTPDFPKLVADLRQRLKGPVDGDELSRLSRSAGKDLLKCFRQYLILLRGAYRKSPPDIHRQLLMYWPDHAETFNCLLHIYEQPVERKEELLQILKLAQASHAALAGAH